MACLILEAVFPNCGLRSPGPPGNVWLGFISGADFLEWHACAQESADIEWASSTAFHNRDGLSAAFASGGRDD